MRSVIEFKSDNFHEVPAQAFFDRGGRLSADGSIVEGHSLARRNAWIEKYLRLSVHTPDGIQPTPRASAPNDSTLYLWEFSVWMVSPARNSKHSPATLTFCRLRLARCI